jgi:tetratricopeptide (TPR) repeat protein
MLVSLRLKTLLIALGLLVGCLGMSGALAQGSTLSHNVAVDLLAAYEELEEENYSRALVLLNELMTRRGDRMTDFDRASVLQVRGSAHVNMDNLDEGLNDFAEALRIGALPDDQNERLRFNLAQLYFATERYEESIAFFNRWLEGDVEPSDNTFFMLAAAHYHLDQFERALESIDRAMALTEEPNRRYYELKNVLLNELDRVRDRTELMKEMVEIWPKELSFWRQLSGLYLDQDMQQQSFAVLESAYLAGLIESSTDIIVLAQFYSSFNNPHRGANLIVEEMERGRIERNVRNLELLSQLWSQAREHRRAIPVLREAARMSETGDLFFRLGQALLADEQYDQAEVAFQNSIDTGGLDNATLAEVWLLLGTARFNQTGPGDREQRRSADQAFAQAERFSASRAQARDWRTYIRAINETESRQAMLEQQQSERMAVAAEERMLQSCRALQIAGRELTPECRQILGAAADGPPGDAN